VVDRQAEPDPIEVGLSERHLVRPLDPLAGVEPPLLHEPSVDPDQVPQRFVLGVVGADDRRSVIATTCDHDDLVRRSRIRLRRDCENDKNTHAEQEQSLQDLIPLLMILIPTYAADDRAPSPLSDERSPRARQQATEPDRKEAPFRFWNCQPMLDAAFPTAAPLSVSAR
jgi:hypothetical protein